MKITIDIEAIEVKQILDAIIKSDAELKIITPPTVPASFITAKKLIDSARKLDKAIDETKPTDSVLLNNTVLHCNTESDKKLPETTKTLPKTTQPKAEMPLPPTKGKQESTAYKMKAVEQPKPTTKPTSGRKQPGEAPICVRTWSPEELNLLRTCPSDDSAKFVYASHFKDSRSEGAIKQKWYKMNLAGDILRIGDTVRVDGENKQGIIQSFTDNHQCANIGYSGDPASYQTNISRIRKVNKE